LARGLFQTVSASVSADQALGVLEVSTRAAVAGNADLFATVDGLTSVMNAYGNEALGASTQLEASQRVADLFFQTNRLGKTTVEELSRSLGQVAPVAAALEVPFEDVSAALATMTAQGLNTRRSTTFLAQALSNVLRPTDEARRVAGELGVEFSSAALASKGLLGFLADMKMAAGDDQEAMAKLFGSVEAFKAVTILTSEQGIDKFSQSLLQMRDAAGSVDTALEKVSATAGMQGARLREAGKALFQALGFATLGARTSAVKIMADALSTLADLASRNQGLVRLLMGVAAAASAITAGVGGIVAVTAGLAIAKAVLVAYGGVALTAFGAMLPITLALGAAIVGLTAGAALFAYAWRKDLGGIRDSTRSVLGRMRRRFALFVAGFVAEWGRMKKRLAPIFEYVEHQLSMLVYMLFPRLRGEGGRAADVAISLGEAFALMAAGAITSIALVVGGLVEMVYWMRLAFKGTKLLEAIGSGNVGQIGVASAQFAAAGHRPKFGSAKERGLAQLGVDPGTLQLLANQASQQAPGQVVVGGTVPLVIELNEDGRRRMQVQAEAKLEAQERVGNVTAGAKASVVDGGLGVVAGAG